MSIQFKETRGAHFYAHLTADEVEMAVLQYLRQLTPNAQYAFKSSCVWSMGTGTRPQSLIVEAFADDHNLPKPPPTKEGERGE